MATVPIFNVAKFVIFSQALKTLVESLAEISAAKKSSVKKLKKMKSCIKIVLDIINILAETKISDLIIGTALLKVLQNASDTLINIIRTIDSISLIESIRVLLKLVILKKILNKYIEILTGFQDLSLTDILSILKQILVMAIVAKPMVWIVKQLIEIPKIKKKAIKRWANVPLLIIYFLLTLSLINKLQVKNSNASLIGLLIGASIIRRIVKKLNKIKNPKFEKLEKVQEFFTKFVGFLKTLPQAPDLESPHKTLLKTEAIIGAISLLMITIIAVSIIVKAFIISSFLFNLGLIGVDRIVKKLFDVT